MSRSAESRARTSAALRAYHARNPGARKGVGAGQPKSREHRAKLAAVNRRSAAIRLAATWDEVTSGDPDRCWQWPHQFKNGYGRIPSGADKGRRAHRVSWEREHGPIPEGLDVLHHCDNPPCCNPAHLYLGTDVENVRDRMARQRGVQGEQVNTNKLTEVQVYEIRRRRDGGERLASIAADFGVTKENVSFIARRVTWKHLPEAQASGGSTSRT